MDQIYKEILEKGKDCISLKVHYSCDFPNCLEPVHTIQYFRSEDGRSDETFQFCTEHNNEYCSLWMERF